MAVYTDCAAHGCSCSVSRPLSTTMHMFFIPVYVHAYIFHMYTTYIYMTESSSRIASSIEIALSLVRSSALIDMQCSVGVVQYAAHFRKYSRAYTNWILPLLDLAVDKLTHAGDKIIVSQQNFKMKSFRSECSFVTMPA